MNQKNPPQVLRSEMRADSVPVDEDIFMITPS